MRAQSSFARMLITLAIISWVVPMEAFAEERIGSAYRGPRELVGGGQSGAEEDPDANVGNEGEGGEGGEGEGGEGGGEGGEGGGGTEGGGDPGIGTGGGTAPGGGPGKTASFNGKIIFQWWWEHNKDRFIARATKRGRANAGSALYWFGSGAKYPPRNIQPVSQTQRATKVFKTFQENLKARVDAGVRAEAAIAMGKLGNLPVADADKKDGQPDNAVVRALLSSLGRESNPLVRSSAILGLGICGDAAGCAKLLKMYPNAPSKEKAYMALAFGLARYAEAIPLLIKRLPRNASDKSALDPGLAAIHGLGLMGPAVLQNEAFQKAKVESKLVKMARKRGGEDAIRVQAIVALGRMQASVKTVRIAAKDSTKSVQWAAILALANYSDDPAAAKDAANTLTGRDGIGNGDGQTTTFGILAAGDLASRLSPNSPVRKTLLKALRKDALDKNNPYAKSAAALALGIANDTSSIDAMAEYLEKTTDHQARAGLCLGLGLLRATEHAQLIIDKVLTPTGVRADTRGYAALGLALMGDTTRVAELLKYQDSSKASIQMLRQTPLALGVLGDRTQVRTLIRHFSSEFKSKERYEAGNAAYALGWIRDEAVITQLDRLARSGNKKVRGMAIIALGYAAAVEEINPLTRCYENVSHEKSFDWTLLWRVARIL